MPISSSFPFFSSTLITDCGCVAAGTVNNARTCNSVSGQCDCKTNVFGQTCATCRAGHFNLDLSNPLGCTPCDCFLGGSTDVTVCNAVTGQCTCRPGFTGRRCDTIITGYYLPNFHGIRFEGEDQSLVGQTGATLFLREAVDTQFQYTGRGYISLAVDNAGAGSFTFSVPSASLPARSGLVYCLYLRYRLVNVPTSATVRVTAPAPASFIISSGGTATSLTLNAGACNVLRIGTVTPVCTGACPANFLLGLTFSITPNTGTVLIDSISFRPQLNTLPEFRDATSGGLAAFTAAGCTSSCLTATDCSLTRPTGVCKTYQISAMAGLFSGALREYPQSDSTHD